MVGKVYVANFGKKHVGFDYCRERSVITSTDDELVADAVLRGDGDTYVQICVDKLYQEDGEASVDPGVARGWWKSCQIFTETSGDIWLRAYQGRIWWTESLDSEISPEIVDAPAYAGVNSKRQLRRQKACMPWSDKSRSGKELRQEFLPVQAFRYAVNQNAIVEPRLEAQTYFLKLLNDEDVSAFMNLPNWIQAEVGRKGAMGRTYEGLDRCIEKMVAHAYSAANQSGKAKSGFYKNKEVRFNDDEFKQYIRELFQQQNGRCALTSLALSADEDPAKKDFLCSLDRINSEGHYERGNLQVVCQFANSWKSNSDNSTFLSLIEAIREWSPDRTLE